MSSSSLKSFFNLETARRGNVFEVNTAKSGRNLLHRAHDLVRVFCIQTDRKRVDAGKLFEQHRLAFHDRHGRGWTDIAKAEHGGPIGNDRDSVLFDCERKDFFRISVNGLADARDSGRVGHRRSARVFKGTLETTSILPPKVHEERRIRNLQQFDTVDILHCFDDLFTVFTRGRADGDVADDVIVADRDDIDRADVAARTANRHRQFTK